MLEVRLIGIFDIQCDGRQVTISSRTAQSLLAYLMLTAGILHRREKLAGMFWPDTAEEKARAYLRHELWRIRKTLSTKSKTVYLITDDIHISFNASAEYWLDVTVLKNVRESSSIEELIQGLSLFQGELLPGFYDDWVTQEREHLQAIYEKKITRLLELLEKEKRWNDILEWAELWISLGEETEVAYLYLMIAYDALGDRIKVTSTYQRCVQALRELDLEPSEETRTLAFKRTSKLNIPIPLTSFIGREKELKEIANLFSKARLITLTGSGGVGKTRLAIQIVAEVLDRFPDGVLFLDLAPLSDPILVPNTLVSVLGLHESGDLPITDLLINYFHSRTALIIFDNCEHLIDASAQLINLLLTSCEHFAILATSREALRVSGEVPYRVPSLEIPKLDVRFDTDEISNIESVKLFAERAGVTSPRFATSQKNAHAIAQICQRLDGIPLAIELAAARTNLLTVEQIARRLDDRFNLLNGGLRSALPRHQTLRAMIEWSYDLLTEKERTLFSRLAVFMGGWTLEAAEQVCIGSSIELGDVLDLLTQLVNKSLVVIEATESGETRYRMLETIRQYGREQLIESGEEDIRARHLKYFLQLSEQVEPELRGPAQMQWYAHLKDERDNIRVALEWADKIDVEGGLYLSARLHRFWESLDLREGNYWLSKFLQRSTSHAYPEARAKALYIHGLILEGVQHLDAARLVAEECLKLYRALGDQGGEVDGLLLLAWNHWLTATEVIELSQQALELAESLGDAPRQIEALRHLGYADQSKNRFTYWERAIKLARSFGDVRVLADILSTIGLYLVLDGDNDSGQKHLDESYMLYQRFKMNPPPEHLLSAYGQIALIRGNYEKARSYLQDSARLHIEFGNRHEYLFARVRLGYVALREGNLAEARHIFAETIEDYQKDKFIIGAVFALEGIASIYVTSHDIDCAARLVGWADATRELVGDFRLLLEQEAINQIISACLAKMGEVAYANAYDEGRKMSLDEAVALALINQNKKFTV